MYADFSYHFPLAENLISHYQISFISKLPNAPFVLLFPVQGTPLFRHAVATYLGTNPDFPSGKLQILWLRLQNATCNQSFALFVGRRKVWFHMFENRMPPFPIREDFQWLLMWILTNVFHRRSASSHLKLLEAFTRLSWRNIWCCSISVVHSTEFDTLTY